MMRDTIMPTMRSEEMPVTRGMVVRTARLIFERYTRPNWGANPPTWHEFLELARANPDMWNSLFDGVHVSHWEDLSEFGGDADEVRAVLKVAEAVLCAPEEMPC